MLDGDHGAEWSDGAVAIIAVVVVDQFQTQARREASPQRLAHKLHDGDDSALVDYR